MSAKTLFEKIWGPHIVHEDVDGTTLLYIDRHLVHEVTSPQAFEGLRLAGRTPRRSTAGRARSQCSHNQSSGGHCRSHESDPNPNPGTKLSGL